MKSDNRRLAIDCDVLVSAAGGHTVGPHTLLVADGIIQAVGPSDSLGPLEGVERVGGPHTLVAPGFVNAHQHGIPHSQAAADVSDGPLEPWMVTLLASPSVDPYSAARRVAAQQLRAGTTTTVHQHYTFTGTPEEYDREIRAFLSGYRDGGIRVVFAADFKDRGEPVHFEQAFLASLPPTLARAAQELTVTLPPLAELTAVIAGIAGDVRGGRYGQAMLMLGPSGPVWCSDELFRGLVALATEHDLGITSHVLESPYERAFGPRAYGGEETVPALDRLGVLGPRFVLAHGCQLSPADAALLAARGVTVASNPGSNLRLHNGVAPVTMLLDAGVNVAIGTDSFALGDRDNILDEVRLMRALQRPAGAHEPGLTARTMFSILTENGARAIGRPDLCRLAPGAPADLVLVDLDAISPPGSHPDPTAALIAIAQPADFRAVIAHGRIVARGGVTVDQPERPRFQWPSDLRRELISELMPHVRDYYAQIPI